MFQVDRTGIVSRQEWHRFDPWLVQGNPISADRQADTALLRKPTTGRVKERLVYAPHDRLLFIKKAT
jgi:hypothetical protein